MLCSKRKPKVKFIVILVVVPVVEQPRQQNPEIGGSGLVKHIVELKVVCPDEDKLKDVKFIKLNSDENYYKPDEVNEKLD
jgi:hypothetical protein